MGLGGSGCGGKGGEEEERRDENAGREPLCINQELRVKIRHSRIFIVFE